MTGAQVTTPEAAEDGRQAGVLTIAGGRVRRVAWLVILVADVGLLAWSAMAALLPERLLGPGSLPILPAGYQGFTGYSWENLAATAPRAADYITLLFRMFGMYGVAFSLLAIAIAATSFRRGDPWAWWALLVGNTITFIGAMAYDQIVHAVGPFELTEYIGLGAIYGFLAMTAPFGRHGQRTAVSSAG